MAGLQEFGPQLYANGTTLFNLSFKLLYIIASKLGLRSGSCVQGRDGNLALLAGRSQWRIAPRWQVWGFSWCMSFPNIREPGRLGRWSSPSTSFVDLWQQGAAWGWVRECCCFWPRLQKGQDTSQGACVSLWLLGLLLRSPWETAGHPHWSCLLGAWDADPGAQDCTFRKYGLFWFLET